MRFNVDTKIIKKLIMREAVLSFYDQPKKLQKIRTYVDQMKDGDIIKFAKQHEITTNKVIKLQESVMANLGTLLGATYFTPLWVGYRAIKAIGDRCIRRCGSFGLKSQKWKICTLRCDQEKAKRAIQLARKATPHCDEAKNPKKCHRMVQDVIGRAQQDIARADVEIAKMARVT